MVETSKKVDWIFSIKGLFLDIKEIISLFVIALPSILILSLKLIRCGDVYNPTFLPYILKILSMKALQEPFPFVPATCIVLIFLWGLPTNSDNFIVCSFIHCLCCVMPTLFRWYHQYVYSDRFNYLNWLNVIFQLICNNYSWY